MSDDDDGVITGFSGRAPWKVRRAAFPAGLASCRACRALVRSRPSGTRPGLVDLSAWERERAVHLLGLHGERRMGRRRGWRAVAPHPYHRPPHVCPSWAAWVR